MRRALVAQAEAAARNAAPPPPPPAAPAAPAPVAQAPPAAPAPAAPALAAAAPQAAAAADAPAAEAAEAAPALDADGDDGPEELAPAYQSVYDWYGGHPKGPLLLSRDAETDDAVLKKGAKPRNAYDERVAGAAAVLGLLAVVITGNGGVKKVERSFWTICFALSAMFHPTLYARIVAFLKIVSTTLSAALAKGTLADADSGVHPTALGTASEAGSNALRAQREMLAKLNLPALSRFIGLNFDLHVLVDRGPAGVELEPVSRMLAEDAQAPTVNLLAYNETLYYLEQPTAFKPRNGADATYNYDPAPHLTAAFELLHKASEASMQRSADMHLRAWQDSFLAANPNPTGHIAKKISDAIKLSRAAEEAAAGGAGGEAAVAAAAVPAVVAGVGLADAAQDVEAAGAAQPAAQ